MLSLIDIIKILLNYFACK